MANPLKMLKLKPQGIQFIKEVLILAPPKKVWSAVIKPGEWFFFDATNRGKHSFDLRPGGQWTRVNPDGTAMLVGTVAYFEPGKLLRLSGPLGLTHLPVTAVIILELQPKGDTTLLRLGMRVFGFLDADVKKRMQGAWTHLLGQIKAVAEK